MKSSVKTIAAAALVVGAPVAAKDDVQLTKCETSLGTVAVVDGDTQGWTEYGLGSPRELITALAIESGCFTPHSTASADPADFLMNVIGGSSEEVDKSIEMGKAAASEALLRSGAASSLLSKVPIGGALLGAFGGLGGKKKKVAAGIKLISPLNGQTVAMGSGTVKKSTLSMRGMDGWGAGVQAAGYAGSKNGKMMAEAFVLAFNQLVTQQASIAAAPKAAPAPAAASEVPTATVALDTIMRSGPSAGSEEVRMLRTGTELMPTGQRSGLFIEVEDNYGTRGWVSVEDLG